MKIKNDVKTAPENKLLFEKVPENGNSLKRKASERVRKLSYNKIQKRILLSRILIGIC